METKLDLVSIFQLKNINAKPLFCVLTIRKSDGAQEDYCIVHGR